ncbi:MAG: hypothetical protein FWD70_00590 [Desulfuromonadales bacterium]|nr:hypothetical protein [Desulfuromonadales bacterium]
MTNFEDKSKRQQGLCDKIIRAVLVQEDLLNEVRSLKEPINKLVEMVDRQTKTSMQTMQNVQTAGKHSESAIIIAAVAMVLNVLFFSLSAITSKDQFMKMRQVSSEQTQYLKKISESLKSKLPITPVDTSQKKAQ